MFNILGGRIQRTSVSVCLCGTSCSIKGAPMSFWLRNFRTIASPGIFQSSSVTPLFISKVQSSSDKGRKSAKKTTKNTKNRKEISKEQKLPKRKSAKALSKLEEFEEVPGAIEKNTTLFDESENVEKENEVDFDDEESNSNSDLAEDLKIHEEDIENEGYHDPDSQVDASSRKYLENEMNEDADLDELTRSKKKHSKKKISEEAPDDVDEETNISENDEDNYQSKYLTHCFPNYAAEYDKGNKKPLEEVLIDAADIVTWNCPACQEKWKCAVFVRCALKNNCPSCYVKSHPTVATLRPDLVRLFDYSKNIPFETPDRLPADSRKSVYWLCAQCKQSYPARVKDRCADKSKCPSCSLTSLHTEGNLVEEENFLLQEWHPLKNGDLQLDQIQPSDSKTKVWWLCATCGHDWEATVAARLSRRNRTPGKKCPVCSNAESYAAL